MRACWLKWVGRDWSISADYIWLNYSDVNNSQPKLTAFYSMLEHPEGASELVFSLPFMLSKHLSTFAVSCFEDLPCLSLLSMSVWK